MGDSAGFDFQPCLKGTALELRPLRAEDFEPLAVAASDPLIWQQHPDPLRHERERFRTTFFEPGLESGRSLAIIDRQTHAIIGSSRYYDWLPAQKEVAIGYTFLARSHWGGAANRELKALMIAHAFSWADTIRFHVGQDNWRSRRALEKLGAEYDRDEIRDVNGIPQNYVHYQIRKAAWNPPLP